MATNLATTDNRSATQQQLTPPQLAEALGIELLTLKVQFERLRSKGSIEGNWSKNDILSKANQYALIEKYAQIGNNAAIAMLRSTERIKLTAIRPEHRSDAPQQLIKPQQPATATANTLKVSNSNTEQQQQTKTTDQQQTEQQQPVQQPTATATTVATTPLATELVAIIVISNLLGGIGFSIMMGWVGFFVFALCCLAFFNALKNIRIANRADSARNAIGLCIGLEVMYSILHFSTFSNILEGQKYLFGKALIEWLGFESNTFYALALAIFVSFMSIRALNQARTETEDDAYSTL